MMPILAGGSLDLLAVNPGLAIWTVITFSVVMLILWRFAWKPIVEALDARNSKVEDDLKASEDLRKEAERLLKDYESKIDSAKHEVNELLDEAKRDAELLRSNITKEAQEEAAQIKNRAQHDIEQAKIKAIKEVQDYSVDIAMQLVSSVLKGGLDKNVHRDMVLKELDHLKSNN